jgi:O-antigen biosynthesis protein
LIETPPRFGSRRFREILAPAFGGDPLTALMGLYWMATRRRVRGWSSLMVAASKGALNYARWTRHGERRALEQYRRLHPRTKSAPLLVVLLLDMESAPGAAELSVATIRSALGDGVIYSAGPQTGVNQVPGSGGLSEALSTLAERHPTAWLLAINTGDRLSPVLGDVLARALGTGDEVLAYWDEDCLHVDERRDPWVKPDWDPLLFGNVGSLVGASVTSIAVADRVAHSFPDERLDQSGIQRLLMSVAAIERPKHISLILTHRHAPSAARRVTVDPPPAPSSWPSVSIIIPTRDRPELLAACLEGIGRTDYPGALQIIVMDNGSRDPAALELLKQVEKTPQAKVLRDDGKFNFSRLNNRAASAAGGEFLCLLNNDVEPLDADWLAKLIRYAVTDRAGAVGAQLLYPSGRIQHAGVAIGVGGAAGHVQKGVDPAEPVFWTWHAVTREVSAVTAAVMVVKKSAFDHVGGFDEAAFAVAFNDIDLCLRLKQNGLRNIYVAEARLVHFESESRGDDRSPAHARRFASELALLQERWSTQDYQDPHFSPLFSRLVERCVLAP